MYVFMYIICIIILVINSEKKQTIIFNKHKMLNFLCNILFLQNWGLNTKIIFECTFCFFMTCILHPIPFFRITLLVKNIVMMISSIRKSSPSGIAMLEAIMLLPEMA